LRADAVLEGSVQKVKDRLRITVRLFRVKDETPLWSGGFDESANDLLQVEDSISDRVVKALRLNLASRDREALIRHQTSNPEAYESYMKGRYFWNQRSKEGLIKATEYFEKAISEDPNYDRAYAGLADCYALQANAGNFARDEGYLKAKRAARKALELDDHLAEAHASLGFILRNYDWDWQGCEAEFQRAIELNPNYATAHQWYGQTLARMGNLDEALREEKLAQELDPLSPVIYVELGGVYFYRRQFDQAVEQYQRALEIAPASGQRTGVSPRFMATRECIRK
jgi:tetratricopeptide (TPR) repeat protein